MRPIAVNEKRIGGAFHPFEKEKVVVKTLVVAAAPASSTTENTIGVGTPKQIRELMKVDGLTNDEVKSHLQTSLSVRTTVSLCLYVV
ncbi:uncharacterized protein A4U43_C04F20420 [Asparagus officinalis]|uniref:HTH myb-type domain-containing protein n=1 Tax=Asparagus officinalis TaxID=4686 RepID=A0A5P1F2G5_ASPOF|nr:uncharacterized protein A4U43_C04F20420 [Asparagus officinalis]